jgi:hypothetical protein
MNEEIVAGARPEMELNRRYLWPGEQRLRNQLLYCDCHGTNHLLRLRLTRLGVHLGSSNSEFHFSQTVESRFTFSGS